MSKIQDPALLAARVLMSLIFITSGWSKLSGYAGTQAYMEAMGVPGALLPLVILTELGGGLAILLGFQTRIAAFLLAGFCLVSGYLFHYIAAQAGGDGAMMQMINFWKNVAMGGGFVAILAAGAGVFSIDGKLGKA
ncbi:Inner membrane protein YqjF [Hartmannibacter diazotrophicus]|uniref:Inner membrane protein YqjF n=1 Tax=Hartmannibacter diazotrophicus TaxID=1482074 RepID=A0A2C9D341_9HYPH|nr:DoxX family protein [Hartmannibacter diazotrophicus]SON54609.1 Inner membrane protein YqjF [Hartmannibacter diazotrophicus]